MEHNTFENLKGNDIPTNYLYELMLPQIEDDKYYFDFWYFPFLISCKNTSWFDKHIFDMKEYVYWILFNMKENIGKNEELFKKYSDLFQRTIFSFVRIKDEHIQQLSNDAKNTVNFYSNIEAVKQFREKYLE